MKKIIPLFLLITCFSCYGHSQAIDTVSTYNFGKMPPVYFSNKQYWERNYDNQNHLLFEALKYNECFIGPYSNYWTSGKVKTTGQYLSNSSGNWADLRQRGLCSVMDSTWKNYDENGHLSSTVIYKEGKLVKEE